MNLYGKNLRLKIVEVKNDELYVDTVSDGILKTKNNDLIIKYKSGDFAEFFLLPVGNQKPLLMMGKALVQVNEFARLRVLDVCPEFAKVDIGLDQPIICEKDDQIVRLEKNKYYNFYVFIDNQSKCLKASMYIDKFIEEKPTGISENDDVEILILSKTNLGYKAIINHKYLGMLYENEVFSELYPGTKTKAIIKKIREDNKIDLRLFRNDGNDIEAFENKIVEYLKKRGGSMQITDNSDPEIIYATFGFSKKNFKKAIGSLYRKNLIDLQTHNIILKQYKNT
jgi:hypothetical protein